MDVARVTHMEPHMLNPGTKVKCAYRGAHVGTVLAIDDPRAWRGSIAFHTKRPTRTAIRAHVAQFPTLLAKDHSVPVLYSFGAMWDRNLSEVK